MSHREKRKRRVFDKRKEKSYKCKICGRQVKGHWSAMYRRHYERELYQKRICPKCDRKKHPLKFYADYERAYGEVMGIKKYLLSRDEFSLWRIETKYGRINGAFVADEVRLEDMVIKPEYRRKGQGTKLWKSVENAFRARNMKRLRGQATPESLPFWRKMGFKETGYVEYGVHFEGRETNVHHIEKIL